MADGEGFRQKRHSAWEGDEEVARAAEGGDGLSSSQQATGETEVKGDAPLFMKRRKAALAWCCGGLAVVVVILGILILILSFTVFKSKEPEISVQDVELGSLGLPSSLSMSDLRLNLSLKVAVSVYNPNHASFRYSNSTSFMFYRQLTVGEASIPAGSIQARGTEILHSTIKLNASNSLLSEPHLYLDLAAGSFPITTRAQLSGRVNVFNIFKHHARASSTCSMSVDIASRSVQNLTCSSHVKLA